MAQRLLAFLLLQFIFLTGLHAAEPANPQPQTLKKPPEAMFLDGQACLNRADIPCAQLTQSRIPSQSAYAKLLSGNIAATQGDFDQAFRLLLPLQAATTLSKPALASLHASLALAYENQTDTLRALEQYTKAASFLSTGGDSEQNEQRLWQLLSQSNRDELIESRGESYDTTIQGWIDLALAAQALANNPAAISSWRKAYPDHVARGFADRQFGTEPPATVVENTLPTAPPKANKAHTGAALQGPVAILLPFGVEAFYPASDAIERGFVAAQALHQDNSEIRLYATNGNKDEIGAIYAKAVQEGAAYVLGPLTRDEATTIAGGQTTVLTLALNQPETRPAADKFFSFGLSIETEVAQIVRLARNAGMQTATIVSSGSPVAKRTAQAFHDAWLADGGEIRLQTGPGADQTLTDMHAAIKAQPADMIFLGANPEEARAMRPFLDPSTPTFGISHLYSGLAFDPSDHVMNAVRFIDLPWILETENAAFAGYREAAAELPPGEMQRWFALGADAYMVLQQLSLSPKQGTTLNGLTGKLRITAKGEIERTLASGRFSNTGVVLEKSP